MASQRNQSSVVSVGEASSGSGNSQTENEKTHSEKEKSLSASPASVVSVAQVWFCVMCAPPHTTSQHAQLVTVCLRYYFVVSLSLTFLNKEVLTAFRAPLFMTLFQFLIALLLIKVIGISGSCVLPSANPPLTPLPTPPFPSHGVFRFSTKQITLSSAISPPSHSFLTSHSRTRLSVKPATWASPMLPW